MPITPVCTNGVDTTSIAVGIIELPATAACNVLCGDNGPCSKMKCCHTLKIIFETYHLQKNY